MAEEAQDIAAPVNVTPAQVETSDPEVDDLAKELGWTKAHLALEYQSVEGDRDALLERLRAAQATQGRRGKESATKPAEAQPATPYAPENRIPALTPEMREAAGETEELMMTEAQKKALFAALGELGIRTKERRITFAAQNGVVLDSYGRLTMEQASALIDEAVRQREIQKDAGAE
jgi:hypothetical protein